MNEQAQCGRGNAVHAPDSDLRIRLFGPAAVWIGGEPLPRLRSRKGMWLLALLVLRAGRYVERDWLAGTLWPESAERQAHYNLRETLSDLRAALSHGGGRIVSPTVHTLQLLLEPHEVDVLAFDAAVRQGGSQRLEEAVAIYRGPLLEGCLEEWAVPERESREQAYVSALTELAAQALERGDHDAATGRARMAVLADPLRESSHRLLMRALVCAGNGAGAQVAYRDLRILLHREANATPDPETTALYESIRSSRPAASPVRATARTRRSVTHPLKDSRRGIPHPITPLVGRALELADIRAAVKMSRLVTLTGPGGVGKTRLAQEIALEAANELPDAAWWVDLATAFQPEQVASAVAAAAGLRQQPGRSIIETVTASFEIRQGAIVLDNCEHVLDAAARMADGLLKSCPDMRILATSRQDLGITGERIYRTPPMSVPDESFARELTAPVTQGPGHVADIRRRRDAAPIDKNVVARVVAFDAVRLFLERAAEASPGFALTQRNLAPVLEICRRLEGIPLALELAAARLRSLDVGDVASGLDDRFTLLSRGSRTALQRHQTLKALIDWSYNLLSGSEQHLLQRLAVFRGGWSLEAAETVCSDSGAMLRSESVSDLLTSLIEQSLVVTQSTTRGGRYRMLETVRQYALDRIVESGEHTALLCRHRDWFCALVENAGRHANGTDGPSWLERIDADYDNIRAALTWSLDADGDAEAALRMVGWLRQFWYQRGYTAEGLEYCRRALAKTPIRSPAERSRALNAGGLMAYIQSDLTESLRMYGTAAAVARDLGDTQSLALALNGLGNLADESGDFATARACYTEALACSRSLPDGGSSATYLSNLGHNAGKTGEYKAARAFLIEALGISRKTGNRRCESYCLHGLAWTYHREADYGRASSFYNQALEMRRAMGFRTGEMETLFEIGDVRLAQADMRLCMDCLQAALRIGRESDILRWESIVLARLGRALAQAGDLRAARNCLVQATGYFADTFDSENLADCLLGWAALATCTRAYDRAARLLGVSQRLRGECAEAVHPHDIRVRQALEQPVRDGLAGDAFETELQAGKLMTVTEAIEFIHGAAVASFVSPRRETRVRPDG